MDAAWLKKQFEEHPHKSKVGLAHMLALEPSAISKILSGTRQIKAKEYAQMQAYFGTDDHVDLSERGVMRDGGDAMNDWVVPPSVLRARPDIDPDQVLMLRVSDSAMSPDFNEGEFVLVDGSVDVPSPPGFFVINDGYSDLTRQCDLVMGRSDAPIVRVSVRSSLFQDQELSLSDLNIVGRVIARLNWI